MRTLTQERLKELFEYSPDTGEFIRKIYSNTRWRPGQVAGTLRNGYIVINIDGDIYQSHWLAFLYCYGRWPAEYIDHINGNKADNRIENLREATRSQNLQNIKGAQRNNKTGLLGASLNKATGKYQSKITANGRTIYLGLFNTAEEAHIAYMAVKRGIHPYNTL